MMDTAPCKNVQCLTNKLTIYQESSRHSSCAISLRFARCIARELEFYFFKFTTVRFSIATEQISVPMVDPFICGMI